MQFLEMTGQDLAGGALTLIDDAADLLIDDLGGRVGDVLALRHGVAEEDLLLVLAVAERAELVAEAPLRHHAPRDVGGLFDVHRRAGRDLRHQRSRHHSARRNPAHVAGPPDLKAGGEALAEAVYGRKVRDGEAC